MTDSLSRLIGRNAQFSEVFAAFGRAISGEEDPANSLKDAYAAVFNPTGVDADLEQATIPAPSGGIEDTTDVADEQGISDICIVPSLPDNASLEQRNLGFQYTTPVKGVLSSAFGWRDLGEGEDTRFHYGLDFAAEEGTEIVAFADGEVFAAGDSSTLGKYIILLHTGGYRTLYAHCSELLVTTGTVCMGTVIARVGQTGSATGPHLHFELQCGTLYLNPIYYVAIG